MTYLRYTTSRDAAADLGAASQTLVLTSGAGGSAEILRT